MSIVQLHASAIFVALRKESVDRNTQRLMYALGLAVALRKESVDRNVDRSPVQQPENSRSPQGERG